MLGVVFFRLLERSNLLNKTCLLTLFRTFKKRNSELELFVVAARLKAGFIVKVKCVRPIFKNHFLSSRLKRTLWLKVGLAEEGQLFG